MGSGDDTSGVRAESGTRPRMTVSLLLPILGPSLAYSVTAIDPLVLSLNLPQISRALNVPPQYIGFLGGAATLVVAAMVLAVGGLGDAHGLKRLLTLGLVTGIVANLLAALSPSYAFLLAMRFLDGAALAAMLGVSLALLTVMVPPEVRPVAIGILMATCMLLYGVTPAVGGWVVEVYGWRWLFLVAPLLSLIALALTVRYVSEPPRRQTSRLDVLGVTLFGIALLGFVHGIGAAQNGISHPQAWLPLAISAVSAAAFVHHQRRTPEPVLNLALFRSPAFTVAVSAALTLNLLNAGFSVVLAQFGSRVLSLSPQQIGLLYLPGTVLITITTVLAGRLVAKYTARPVLLTGLLLLIASGVLMAATAAPTMPLWLLVVATWLCNLGSVVTSTPAAETILSHAPPGKSGAVAAVQPAFGMTGYALGPTIYLVLLNLFFHRRWLADAKARGVSLRQAEQAVDAVRSSTANTPGAPGYDPNLIQHSSGLALNLDFTNGLRLTMLTVSVAPLLLAVVVYLLMPRAPRAER